MVSIERVNVSVSDSQLSCVILTFSTVDKIQCLSILSQLPYNFYLHNWFAAIKSCDYYGHPPWPMAIMFFVSLFLDEFCKEFM